MSNAMTPSQQIVAAYQPESIVLTDTHGRKLSVRALTALEQFRMLRAIGPAQAGNTDYGYMVECIMMVTSIDSVPLLMPKNEQALDAAMEKIGEEGMAAVMVWRTQQIIERRKAAEAALTKGDAPAQDPLEKSAS